MTNPSNAGRKACGKSLEALQKSLDIAIAKRDTIRAKQMARVHDRSQTRARTTTSNANADWVNEEIISLRAQIKAHNDR